jgi:hypothetical protein
MDKNKGRCRDCGATIEWVKTARGKNMPLDLEPAQNRTVVAGEPGNAVVGDGVVYVLGTGSSILLGEVLRVPHFGSCPGRRHGARERPTAVDRDHARVDREAAEHAERDEHAQRALRQAGRRKPAEWEEPSPVRGLRDVAIALRRRIRNLCDSLANDLEHWERREQ